MKFVYNFHMIMKYQILMLMVSLCMIMYLFALIKMYLLLCIHFPKLFHIYLLCLYSDFRIIFYILMCSYFLGNVPGFYLFGMQSWNGSTVLILMFGLGAVPSCISLARSRTSSLNTWSEIKLQAVSIIADWPLYSHLLEWKPLLMQ